MYTLPSFLHFSSLIHAFSTVHEGNMSFVWGSTETVVLQRKKFLDLCGLSLENLVVANLENGSRIHHVEKIDQGKGTLSSDGIFCDALITNVKGLTLGLVTADCLPVIMYDSVGEVIALAHCGWRGTDELLLQKVIHEMKGMYGSLPENIFVGIGPGIRKESYIQKEVLQKQKESWLPFLEKISKEATAIDIVGYNYMQLLEMGVKPEHIEKSAIDTYRDDNYFSHYRSLRTREPEGRFMTIVSLKEYF